MPDGAQHVAGPESSRPRWPDPRSKLITPIAGGCSRCCYRCSQLSTEDDRPGIDCRRPLVVPLARVSRGQQRLLEAC
jgi:hypothetical protein